MKVLEENKNPLFNRKEVLMEVEAEVTPSHVDAEKIISDQFKTPADTFKIKKIEGKFGSKVFKISANIYPSKEEKEETEFKTKQEKEVEAKILEEAKKEEEETKVAEETKEETAEEKTEEKTE